MNTDFNMNCKKAGIFVEGSKGRKDEILEVDIVRLGITKVCKREDLYSHS